MMTLLSTALGGVPLILSGGPKSVHQPGAPTCDPRLFELGSHPFPRDGIPVDGGIRLPPLKERMDQFEEGVHVIVEMLSQPRANFSGQHFTLTDAYCEPKPIQRPHPPIAIGRIRLRAGMTHQRFC